MHRVGRRRAWLMLSVLFGFWNGLHTVRFLNRALYSNYLTGTIPDSIGSASALQLLCVLIELSVSSVCIARVQAENARRGGIFLYMRVVVRWRTLTSSPVRPVCCSRMAL